MNTDKKKKKNTPTASDAPIITFEAHDMVASVWLRQATGGVTYLDFTLHRTYQSKQRRNLSTSDRFLARNTSSLLDVAQQAAKFIERHQAHPELAPHEASNIKPLQPNSTPTLIPVPSRTQSC